MGPAPYVVSFGTVGLSTVGNKILNQTVFNKQQIKMLKIDTDTFLRAMVIGELAYMTLRMAFGDSYMAYAVALCGCLLSKAMSVAELNPSKFSEEATMKKIAYVACMHIACRLAMSNAVSGLEYVA